MNKLTNPSIKKKLQSFIEFLKILPNIYRIHEENKTLRKQIRKNNNQNSSFFHTTGSSQDTLDVIQKLFYTLKQEYESHGDSEKFKKTKSHLESMLVGASSDSFSTNAIKKSHGLQGGTFLGYGNTVRLKVMENPYQAKQSIILNNFVRDTIDSYKDFDTNNYELILPFGIAVGNVFLSENYAGNRFSFTNSVISERAPFDIFLETLERTIYLSKHSPQSIPHVLIKRENYGAKYVHQNVETLDKYFDLRNITREELRNLAAQMYSEALGHKYDRNLESGNVKYDSVIGNYAWFDFDQSHLQVHYLSEAVQAVYTYGGENIADSVRAAKHFLEKHNIIPSGVDFYKEWDLVKTNFILRQYVRGLVDEDNDPFHSMLKDKYGNLLLEEKFLNTAMNHLIEDIENTNANKYHRHKVV